MGIMCGIKIFETCCWLRRGVGIAGGAVMLTCEINASPKPTVFGRTFCTLLFLELSFHGHIFIYKGLCFLLFVSVQIIVTGYMADSVTLPLELALCVHLLAYAMYAE
jgi:hypothetical protein